MTGNRLDEFVNRAFILKRQPEVVVVYVPTLDSGRPAEVIGTEGKTLPPLPPLPSRPRFFFFYNKDNSTNITTQVFLRVYRVVTAVDPAVTSLLLSAVVQAIRYPRGWRLASVTAAKHGGL